MRRLGRALLCLALMTGCSGGVQVAELMPRNDQGWLVQELEFRKEVDLVLVVDDGPSMKPKQAAFERGFHALLEAFFSPWHQVDLQVAQVSSRAGEQRTPGQACSAALKLSYLNTPSPNPLDWSCDPANQELGSGGHRVGPGAVRACLGSFGHHGCGRNAALEHLHASLDGSLKPWVRRDAVLAVLFLSDDRDCSLTNADLLAPDEIDESGGSKALAERCFLRGAKCQGEQAGGYAQCEIRDDELRPPDRPSLMSSQRAVDDLFALKEHRYDQVIALAISGVSDQEESRVGYPLPRDNRTQAPQLGCVQWSLAHAALRGRSRLGQGGERWLGAQAPIRLRAFAEQTTTPQERALYSICVDDLRRSLHEIATQIIARVRPTCIFGALLERHPLDFGAPYCEVIEAGPEGDRLVPECLRGEDGAYLLDPQGQGLARPDGAPRCVVYRVDAFGDQSADPYDDMSAQCRVEQASLEVDLHGDLASPRAQGASWTLRCARSAS